MADDELAQFECNHCGKRFHWTPKLAGKIVRCPCGQVLTCPEHPPIGPEPILQAIPLDEPAPSHASAHTATAAPPVQKVAVRRVQSADAPKKLVEPGVIRDLYMPLALLAAGVAIELIAVAVRHPGNYLAGLLSLGEYLGGQVALMLFGIFAASRLRRFSLGPFPTALLKVLAIAISVPAAMELITPIFGPMCFGSVLIFLAAILCYFTLLGTLFDLQEPETFDCMGVIFFVYVAMFILNKFLLKIG